MWGHPNILNLKNQWERACAGPMLWGLNINNHHPINGLVAPTVEPLSDNCDRDCFMLSAVAAAITLSRPACFSASRTSCLPDSVMYHRRNMSNVTCSEVSRDRSTRLNGSGRKSAAVWRFNPRGQAQSGARSEHTRFSLSRRRCNTSSIEQEIYKTSYALKEADHQAQ